MKNSIVPFITGILCSIGIITAAAAGLQVMPETVLAQTGTGIQPFPLLFPAAIPVPVTGTGGTTPGLNNTSLMTGSSGTGTGSDRFFTEADINLVSQETINGLVIDERITGPGLPPEGWVETSDVVDLSDVSVSTLPSDEVPAMTWSYGCSPTSATMMFGYYDRSGYSNMYTGPTGGGVFPLTNAAWGSSSEGNGQCPLTASQQGLDGRSTKGHKDDYYYLSESSVDPYYGSWTEHIPPDCIGDFMGTNMYQKYTNIDGSTRFWYYNNGAPTYDFTLYDSTSRDGMHGMRLFAESRGYTVTTNYNQYIDAMGLTYGFTYAQYKAEIDAGYPVLIQVNGHTMLGVGYSGTNQVILHNTWDYSKHTMTWGGSYSGRQHYGVGVLHLGPIPIEARFYGVPGVTVRPLTIQFYDASVGTAASWYWDFGDGENSTEQNPVHTYDDPGTYTVNLTVGT